MRYICENDDRDIDFRVVEVTCNAVRKKAQYEKRQKKDADRDGVVLNVETVIHSNTPLEEFRGPYYEQKQKERAAVEAARLIRPREHPPGWSDEEE